MDEKKKNIQDVGMRIKGFLLYFTAQMPFV